MTRLGPDELSELAEALSSACVAHIATGKQVAPGLGNYCPFGALLGAPYPFPYAVAQRTGVPEQDVRAFMCGFDGYRVAPGHADDAAYVLGRQFRERYGEAQP